MSALKPCPFCGGEGCMTAIGDSGFVIRCRSCAAEGPWGKSLRSAEGWWNLRADDLRAALTRAVVAEQWRCMVSVRMVADDECDVDGGVTPPQSTEEEAMASAALAEMWPSAAAVVAERMGEP